MVLFRRRGLKALRPWLPLQTVIMKLICYDGVIILFLNTSPLKSEDILSEDMHTFRVCSSNL